MTTTFKPGDRVRRTSSFHAQREQDSVYRGEEFTVSRIESRNHGVILEGKDSSFSYGPGAFELVAAADRKIQVGDKVRVQYDAVVTEVEDSWDGVRIETRNPREHWDTFGPNEAHKFLTVIEPAPAPEPKPTRREQVNALPDGTRFSCPGPYAPLGHYIKLQEDVVWARGARNQWSIRPGAEHYDERWNEPGEIKLDEY